MLTRLLKGLVAPKATNERETLRARELDQAETLLAAGRAAESIAILEPAARSHPESFEIWRKLGRAYGQAQRPIEAERAFRVAVGLRPDLPEGHYNLALSVANQGKLRDSVKHFSNARRILPHSPEVRNALFPILVTLLQEGGARPESAVTRELAPLDERPLVSVVIPTQNRLQTLRDALDSVHRQGYQNWEAIVVNDGGNDISAVLDSMPRDAAEKIRRIDLQSMRGPAAARNTAVKVAKGDVLAFLDDDDIYAPGHLQCLVSGLRTSHAGMAYTAADLVEEAVGPGKRVEVRRRLLFPGLRYSRPLLFVRNYIPINTWGIRRECFESAGAFDESLHHLEDWDFLLRLSARVSFHQIAQTTTEYRMTGLSDDSVSKRHSYEQGVRALYRRHDPAGLEWVALARELYLEELG